jgi:RNA-binding protein NOB1
VIALAWTLEREVKGSAAHLRTEPSPQQVGRASTRAISSVGEVPKAAADVAIAPRRDEQPADGAQDNHAADGCAGDANTNSNSSSSSNSNNTGGEAGPGSNSADADADDADADADSDSDSDSGGWITPSNIAAVNASVLSGGRSAEEDPLGAGFCCGVLTADYAMQNVIMQMGMRVLAVDGSLVVRGLKRWVVRCHACFAVSIDTERLFCERCGNQTMQRCESTLDAEGNVKVYVRRRPPTQRGHKYSIPLPKGGRNNDLVLREDQLNEKLQKMGLRPQGGSAAGGSASRRAEKDDFMDADHLFFTRGASGNGGRGVEVGFGKRNPNVSKKTIGKKKNKGRR